MVNNEEFVSAPYL